MGHPVCPIFLLQPTHDFGINLIDQFMDMNLIHQQNELDNPEDDLIWNLLAADAKAHPIAPSPWFATRAVAQVRRRGQWSIIALLLRWLMPIPLAGFAVVALLSLQGVGHQNPRDFGKTGSSYVSSDSDFEQHMDLLSSTE